MEAQLQELIPFLRDRNPQVRQIALSNLLPHTPKGSPHRNVYFSGLQAGGVQKAKGSNIIRDLMLLCRDQLSIAHDAFRALVNLSDSPLLVNPLSELPFLQFLVSYILTPQSILADLGSMLLSNLTASSAACSTLLSLTVPVVTDSSPPAVYYATQSRCGTCIPPFPYPTGDPHDVLALPLLIDAFAQGAQVGLSEVKSKSSRKGNLHFLSSVFANVTVLPDGRNFFLIPRPMDIMVLDGKLEYPLAKIAVFTEHQDSIRRGGVASTIKNCAFHAAGHRALLSPDSITVAVPPSSIEAPGIDILPYLLLPLAGPEEFDLEDQEKLLPVLQFLPPSKTREPDQAIRLIHIETLLLLCTTRWGRDYMREHGVYEIVRAAHENESVDKISEHIERLVTLLKGDEAPSTDGDDLPTDVMPDVNATGSDDEDSRIDEV